MAVGARRTTPLRAVSLSLEEVKGIYRLLKAKAHDAAEIELRSVAESGAASEFDPEQAKDLIRRSYDVSVVVTGSKGTVFADYSEEAFSSENLPPEIRRIVLDLYHASSNAALIWQTEFPANNGRARSFGLKPVLFSNWRQSMEINICPRSPRAGAPVVAPRSVVRSRRAAFPSGEGQQRSQGACMPGSCSPFPALVWPSVATTC